MDEKDSRIESMGRARSPTVLEMDIFLAIRDPTCSYCFERYSRIAGIDNIEVIDFKTDLRPSLENFRARNLHRPLLVVVGETHRLAEIKDLPLTGRAPFVVDATGKGPQDPVAQATLVASCTQQEFEEVLLRCVSDWAKLFGYPAWLPSRWEVAPVTRTKSRGYNLSSGLWSIHEDLEPGTSELSPKKDITTSQASRSTTADGPHEGSLSE